MKSICDKCGSENIYVKKETYNEKYEYIKDDWDMSISQHILNKKLVSCDVRVSLVCEDCGNSEVIY